MRARAFASLCILAVTASFVACGPRVRPEMVARIDHVLADQVLSQDEVPPPADYSMMPWEVGQWAIYRTRDSKGNVGVQRNAIVRRDDCGIWLETITQTVSELNRTSMCFAQAPDFGRRSDESVRSAMDLVNVIETQKNDDDVEVIDLRLPENAMIRPMLRSMGQYVFFSADVSQAPREDLAVPAAKFLQTFVFETNMQMGPFRRAYTNWGHPAVPINGLVRSVDDSGSSEIELIGFGTNASDLDAPWPAR